MTVERQIQAAHNRLGLDGQGRHGTQLIRQMPFDRLTPKPSPTGPLDRRVQCFRPVKNQSAWSGPGHRPLDRYIASDIREGAEFGAVCREFVDGQCQGFGDRLLQHYVRPPDLNATGVRTPTLPQLFADDLIERQCPRARPGESQMDPPDDVETPLEMREKVIQIAAVLARSAGDRSDDGDDVFGPMLQFAKHPSRVPFLPAPHGFIQENATQPCRDTLGVTFNPISRGQVAPFAIASEEAKPRLHGLSRRTAKRRCLHPFDVSTIGRMHPAGPVLPGEWRVTGEPQNGQSPRVPAYQTRCRVHVPKREFPLLQGQLKAFIPARPAIDRVRQKIIVGRAFANA